MWIETFSGKLLNLNHVVEISVKEGFVFHEDPDSRYYSHSLMAYNSQFLGERHVIFRGTEEECESAKEMIAQEMAMHMSHGLMTVDGLASTRLTREQVDEYANRSRLIDKRRSAWYTSEDEPRNHRHTGHADEDILS